MALKRSSEIIKVGFSITESGANTFTQSEIDLQLNPLDNEVFVVVAADLDPSAPFNVAGVNTQTAMSVSSTSLTGFGNINSPNVISNAVLDLRQDAGSLTGAPFSRTSLDSPVAALDYIAIIRSDCRNWKHWSSKWIWSPMGLSSTSGFCDICSPCTGFRALILRSHYGANTRSMVWP